MLRTPQKKRFAFHLFIETGVYLNYKLKRLPACYTFGQRPG